MSTTIFSYSVVNYETQKAYRKTKICLSYRQSIGLSGVSCYLCQYSFFRATGYKVTWKKLKFAKKINSESLFLVGAFLGKSARLLQWLVFFLFFRQTTDLIAYVPLFTDFTLAHMYSSVLGLR